MKKLLFCTVAVAMFLVVGCGSNEPTSETNSVETVIETDVLTDDEKTHEEEKNDSQYYFRDNILVSQDVKIEITDYKVIPVGEKGNEYGEKPVIAFWYNTTNLTGNENVNALSAWIAMFRAFQDTDPNIVNELDVGASPDDSLLDTQDATIKKDGTVLNAIAYELDSTTVPVILKATRGDSDEELGEQTYEIDDASASESTDNNSAGDEISYDKSSKEEFEWFGITLMIPDNWVRNYSDEEAVSKRLQHFYISSEPGAPFFMLQYSEKSLQNAKITDEAVYKAVMNGMEKGIENAEFGDVEFKKVDGVDSVRFPVTGEVKGVHANMLCELFLDNKGYLHNISFCTTRDDGKLYIEDFEGLISSVKLPKEDESQTQETKATETEVEETQEFNKKESSNSSDEDVPTEYKNALNKAKSYANNLYMSKQAVYDQLTSEYGENFPEDAAQYAIEHVEADWNNNALEKAESYASTMYMSKKGIYDQLISEYGERFTEDEAQYAIEHVEADWNNNALEKAKSYQDTLSMSKNAIYDQLISEYGEQFTKDEAQYAIDNLE